MAGAAEGWGTGGVAALGPGRLGRVSSLPQRCPEACTLCSNVLELGLSRGELAFMESSSSSSALQHVHGAWVCCGIVGQIVKKLD